MLMALLEMSDKIEHILFGIVWKADGFPMEVAWSQKDDAASTNVLLAEMAKYQTMKMIHEDE
jgi:hypothetical protein